MRPYANKHSNTSFRIVLSPKHVTSKMYMSTSVSLGNAFIFRDNITQAQRILVDIIKTNYTWDVWTSHSLNKYISISLLSSAVMAPSIYFLSRIFSDNLGFSHTVNIPFDSTSETFLSNRRIYKEQTPPFFCSHGHLAYLHLECLCILLFTRTIANMVFHNAY